MTYGVFYDRHNDLNEDKYVFACPCCGSAHWRFQGIVRKDQVIDQEIHHFRRLRQASLGGTVSAIWEEYLPDWVTQPVEWCELNI